MSAKPAIRVVFFASLREAVGVESLTLEAASTADLLDLLSEVVSEDGYAAISARNVRIAVNQTLIEHSVTLSEGDEVAFLPPVTGG